MLVKLEWPTSGFVVSLSKVEEHIENATIVLESAVAPLFMYGHTVIVLV